MAQMIRFTKTTKKYVTVGKFYDVKNQDTGNGYYFDDDAGDPRYVRRSGKVNEFEVYDDIEANETDSHDEQPDGVVCIDFMDGYVAHFHDVDRFDVEERAGTTMVVIDDVEGGRTLIPFDRVRKVRLLHMSDVGN